MATASTAALKAKAAQTQRGKARAQISQMDT
jgi:hypothetical protein